MGEEIATCLHPISLSFQMACDVELIDLISESKLLIIFGESQVIY